MLMKFISDKATPAVNYFNDPYCNLTKSDLFNSLVSVDVISQKINSSENKITVGKEGKDVQSFQNRVLGLPINVQFKLTAMFAMTIEELMNRDKNQGVLDLGITGKLLNNLKNK